MRFFDRLHPISAFIYFVSVLFIAMLTMDPVVTVICYLTGVVFCGMLIGIKKLMGSLACSIPIAAMIALTNPLFSHKGETVLFFLNDNPITKEAIIYGVFASLMLMSVFYWCRCYTEIMSGDKFIYLFGRVIPKLSLAISLTLGFIPKLKKSWREIDDAQKALGIYTSESLADRLRSKFRAMSILLTHSLEGAVEAADSMRARGYGLNGRSSYAIYRFTFEDGVFTAFSLSLAVLTVVLIFTGNADFSYYPTVSPLPSGILSYVLYSAVILLTGISIFSEAKENMLWRYLRSKV